MQARCVWREPDLSKTSLVTKRRQDHPAILPEEGKRLGDGAVRDCQPEAVSNIVHEGVVHWLSLARLLRHRKHGLHGLENNWLLLPH